MNDTIKHSIFSLTTRKAGMRKTLILISLIFLLTSASYADGVQFTATAKTTVRVGEKFQLQFKINAEGSGFKGPRISDFQVLTGPNTSTSSSVQIINSKVTREVSYVFTYILKARQAGSFTIPAATINYKGKQYKSNSLKIKVIKGGTSATGKTTGKDDKDNVFVRAYINNTTPVQGEQIILTYKLFTSVPISNIDDSKISSFPGFWLKNLLGNRKGYTQTREQIEGTEYVVAELKKFALFPQRSGEITIQPAELNCVAQIQSSSQRRSSNSVFDSFFNDPFFNSRYQNIEKQLFSNSLKINVRPLPGKDKPANFSGAVGSYSFKSEIDKTEVKANEAITLKFTLKGQGNLQLIDPPVINFPTDFEVFDPEIKNNIKTSVNGVSGTRTFEYLIIPRNPGDYTIKPVEFSFFNIKTRKYVTQKTPTYNIKVNRGEGNSANITYSGASQEDIQYIGRDIRHIKLPPYNLRPIGFFFFRSLNYYALIFIPVLVFVILLIVWRKNIKRRGNIVMEKNRKATKVSKKRLKTASVFMKEDKGDEFYEEVSKALWGYISDKFNISRSELSMDNVKDKLLGKSVDEQIINQFIETLNNTEFARFAPGDKSQKIEDIYNQALEIISKIERELN
ncbi:MAG: BatD protein [Bacteroidetes bacterium 4572_114]|nr:MAG: BatD protein [Bacteroidetes bacterium 4572_114]